jgi:protoporphyrinogen IX oxidase
LPGAFFGVLQSGDRDMTLLDYEWIKALHIISIIAWMAGMLYLPRLYVYHAQVEPGSPAAEMFKAMERRLLRGIINPSMIAAWGFGIWMLVLNPELLQQGFMHVKLAMVICMQIIHAMLAYYRRQFAAERNIHSARFYRILNEIPMVLIAIIVVMIVVRPRF